MNVSNAVEKLKLYIYTSYKSTYQKIDSNIYRGHLRSLSTEIEDGIALFISGILSGYKVFIDPSIHIDGKNNRPDLLVVNNDNLVFAMIEIKSNMGWCRNASNVINNIIANNEKFSNKQFLECEFSRDEKQIVFYGKDVKLFLISFTNGNCSENKHEINKLYAKEKK